MKKFFLLAAGLLVLAPTGFATAQERAPAPVAPPLSAGTIDVAERQKIETVIRELLDREPELVMRAAANFQQREQIQQQKRAEAAVKENSAALYNNKDDAVAGNPKGDVTVVEFFDYSCGFCKRVHPTVKQLLAEDKNVRYVYKQFPILGPSSLLAAQAATAAQLQGKFTPVHEALITNKEPLTEAKLDSLLSGIKGLDIAKLKADMKGAEVQRRIDATLELGRKLGVNGTPGFIINDKLYPGAMDLNTFKELLAEARKQG